MSDIVKKICGLLKPGQPAEKQCAAAMILAELAPKEAGVVRALSDALVTDNRILRLYVLEAMRVIRSKDCLGAILPLLSYDDETRNKAMDVLAAIGPSSLPFLKKEWQKAATPARVNINAILVRMAKPEPFKVVLDSLLESDPELVRETAAVVRRSAPLLSVEDRKNLTKVTLKFLGLPAVKKNRIVFASGIRILAALGDANCVKTLFTCTTPGNPSEVRREALSGLGSFAAIVSRSSEWVRKLIGYLGENDFPNIVSQTLGALNGVTIPTKDQKGLVDLLNSRHPAVREFAARRLKDVDSTEAANALLPLLAGSDPALRDHAAASLARIPSARPALIREFLACEDPDRAQLLAQILKPHGPTLRKEALKKILDRALDLLDRGDRREAPYFYLLRHADPHFAYDELLREALRAKKSKNYARAQILLHPLEQNPLFDKDSRLELALVSLKLSSKDLGKENRAKDPALGLFRVLLADRDFPLLNRLKKEGSLLDAEDWFFLGFHFAEGSGLERQFAKEALNLVVKKFSKSAKIASAAKNKLKVEALD